MMSNRDYGISRRVHVIKRDYAKSKVDHSCPTTYMHMYIKLKRLQRIEEDQLRITHQNRVLSERILKNMAMPSQVDNHLADDIPDFHSMKANLLMRQRQLMAQTLQNQSLLKKISCVKSEYRREPMFKDYQKMKAIMSRRNRKTTGNAERNYYKQKNEDNKVYARSRLYLAPGSQRKKKQHMPTVAKIDEEAPGPSAFGIGDSNEEFLPGKNELPTVDRRKGRDRQSPLPALVNKSGHSQADESFSRTTTGYETVDGVESYDEVKDMLQKGLGSSVMSGGSEKQTKRKPWMDATSDGEDESKEEEASLLQPSAKTPQLQEVVEPFIEPIDLTPLNPLDESSIQRKKRSKRPPRPVPKPATNTLTSGGDNKDFAFNYAGQNMNQGYGDVWAEQHDSKNDPDWVDEELPAKELWTPPTRSFLRGGATKKRVSVRSPASEGGKPSPGKAAPKAEVKKAPVETPKAKPVNMLDETSIQKKRRADRNKDKSAPAVVVEKVEQPVEKEEEQNHDDEQWEDVPSGVVEHYKNDEFNWPDGRAPAQFRPSSRQIQMDGAGGRRGSRPMPNASQALAFARSKLLKKLDQERIEPEHAITNRLVASTQEMDKKQPEPEKKGPVAPPVKKYEWGTLGQLREANFARVDVKRRAEARARAELELKKRKEAERLARKLAAEKKKRKALRAAREAERRREKDEEARRAREEMRRKQKRVARKYYYRSDSSSSGESSSSSEDEKKQEEDRVSVIPEQRSSEQSGSSSGSESCSDSSSD